MSDNLTANLPPVKPWEERSGGVLPLAGGNQLYLDALAWIVQTCQSNRLTKVELKKRYQQQYDLSQKTAGSQIDAAFRYGLLQVAASAVAPSASVVRWRESGRTELIIGAMHVNVKLIGELLDEIREPRSKEALRQLANNRYGFTWDKTAQIDFRLCWLRSAGLARMINGSEYQATETGLAFIEQVELYRPRLPRPPPPPLAPPTPPAPPPPPLAPPTPPAPPVTLAERLRTLSVEGSKHKEFEVAVRDAFEFLGFEAQLLSGAGQTDVLVTGVRKSEIGDHLSMNRWQYRAAVDAKAVSKGSLTSGQVTWPAIEKHRKQHQADFALLVGPSPTGQLLDFAANAQIGVLAAEHLADLVDAHAVVPLPLAEYHGLFVDENGRPVGGTVELRQIEAARSQQAHRRDLLLAVHEAVTDIATKGLKADQSAISVTLNMLKRIQASPAEVAAAVELLAGQWLGAIARNEDGASGQGDFVPTAPGRLVAQRLRWLADAFDELEGDATPPSGSG